VIGQSLVLAGAVFMLLAGIGVLRFGDTLARMHALTKASSLGVILVLSGTAWALENVNDVTSLLLAIALQLLTMPVGANLMSATTYAAPGIPLMLRARDELADGGAGPGPASPPEADNGEDDDPV
jgi:multicomponent Na+:H+ antiporter subunit G